MKDDDREAQLDLSKLIDKPFTVTFTAHLPFPIGVPDALGHRLQIDLPFIDTAAEEVFGSTPFVNIRVFEFAEPGLPSWEKGTHAAIESFYGVQLEDAAESRYGEEEFAEHHQWVTLETPHARLEGEDLSDAGFAFHRCLHFLNLFLRSVLLINGDVRVRPVSTHDLRPLVVIGAIPKGEQWRVAGLLHMHPEARPEGLLADDRPFTQDQLNEALRALITNKPYINTIIWRSRAQRSLRQTGDAADAIISFQIAAETLLFDTYRMLLVDEGLSSREIASELESDTPFKGLLTSRFPDKLGGRWDVTAENTPIGRYWKDLYLTRNSIIHRGFQPHLVHAIAAQEAYWALRDYVETRLWAKHNSYPRTLLVRLGVDQLVARGWFPATMQSFVQGLKGESGPFYWPYDLAGRQPHR